MTDGYSINFKVEERGLAAVEEGKHYKPDLGHIKNFFRFEGRNIAGQVVTRSVPKRTEPGMTGNINSRYFFSVISS